MRDKAIPVGLEQVQREQKLSTQQLKAKIRQEERVRFARIRRYEPLLPWVWQGYWDSDATNTLITQEGTDIVVWTGKRDRATKKELARYRLMSWWTCLERTQP